MKLFRIILPVLALLFFFRADSQENTDIYREIGINVTPFIAQFVPFNETTSRTGPYDVSLKRYKGQHAFRMGFGMHVRPDIFFDSDQLNSFNLRLGYQRRLQVYKQWHFTYAADGFLYAGSLNLPDDISDDDAGLGLGISLGIEYHINEMLYISTESTMLGGLSASSGILLEVIPPMGVYFHMRFKKKKSY